MQKCHYCYSTKTIFLTLDMVSGDIIQKKVVVKEIDWRDGKSPGFWMCLDGEIQIQDNFGAKEHCRYSGI